MKDLSFYDQVGFLFPGSVLLIGLLALFPELRTDFSSGGVSVGGLGLFLIVAYVLGQLLAEAMHIFLVKIFWAFFRGQPSEWLVKEMKKNKAGLLWEGGNQAVLAKLKARNGIGVDPATLTRKEWQKRFGLIYRQAFSSDTGGGRIQVFNGMYGLAGGIAMALIVLAVALPVLAVVCPGRLVSHWHWWAEGLAVLAILFLIRMYRFGVLFASEVYRVFVQLPDAL